MRSQEGACSPLGPVIQPIQQLHGDQDVGSSLSIVERQRRRGGATRVQVWIQHLALLYQPAQQRVELSCTRSRDTVSTLAHAGGSCVSGQEEAEQRLQALHGRLASSR